MNRPLAPIDMIRLAAEYLGNLREDVAFLGGAIVGLLLTDPAARTPRATEDVDVVIELGSLLEFYDLEDRLRKLGFRNDPFGPVCRFLRESIILDVMPTHSDVIGFTNTWYSAALKAAERRSIGNGMEINVVAAPYFLATKLEAFQSPRREGHGDFRLSRDFEDIVVVLDGREGIVEEVLSVEESVRRFIQEQFAIQLADHRYSEGIAAHLDPDAVGGARALTVRDRVRKIVEG